MHNQQQRSEPGRHCVSHCKLQHWQQWHSVCLPDLQAEAADLRQELASGHSAIKAAILQPAGSTWGQLTWLQTLEPLPRRRY